MKMIAECKHWWRLWSVRVNLVGALLAGLQWIDPNMLLGLIRAMPPEVRAMLPERPVTVTIGVLFALSTVLRLIPQKKMQEVRDGASS